MKCSGGMFVLPQNIAGVASAPETLATLYLGTQFNIEDENLGPSSFSCLTPSPTHTYMCIYTRTHCLAC